MIHAPSTRRAFLAAAATAAGTPATAKEDRIPIIDSHFHLYDTTRSIGVPYPPNKNAPPFLPKDFRETATPLGIVGGIVVEASPWVEDNLWVLTMIEKEPMIVGLVGDLDPLKPEFREYLDRYRRNKLFLGIRYGNVWPGHDLPAAVNRPEFIDNMKALAETGLVLEVANPRFDLMEATVRLTDKVPNLRVVVGHLQALPLPASPEILKSYSNNLRELRQRKAYAKVSGVPGFRANVQEPDPAVYKRGLDFIYDIFGEDFIVYAGRNKTALEILQAYFMAKGRPAAEKFFWKNSVPAFKWVRRDPSQPQLS